MVSAAVALRRCPLLAQSGHWRLKKRTGIGIDTVLAFSALITRTGIW